jgi:hypothetical protein
MILLSNRTFRVSNCSRCNHLVRCNPKLLCAAAFPTVPGVGDTQRWARKQLQDLKHWNSLADDSRVELFSGGATARQMLPLSCTDPAPKIILAACMDQPLGTATRPGGKRPRDSYPNVWLGKGIRRHRRAGDLVGVEIIGDPDCGLTGRRLLPQCPQTVESEQRLGWLDPVEPLPNLRFLKEILRDHRSTRHACLP